MRIQATLLLTVLLLSPTARATDDGVALLDNVTDAVERRFYRGSGLDRAGFESARDALRERARAATSRRGDLAASNELLAWLSASHTFLLPKTAYDDIYLCEMRGKNAPRYGATAIVRGEKVFVESLLDGGAAEIAGVRRGDEIVAIDGFPGAESPRLVPLFDRGTGAAPCFELDAHDGRPATLLLRREAAGPALRVTVEPSFYGRIAASRASVRTTERAGRKIGYVHLWHVLNAECGRILDEALAGPLHDADAVLVDLRGWGGHVDVALRVRQRLTSDEWRGRVYALTDERTRSAKEVIAHGLRKAGVPIVGRKTAGAVLGAAMIDVKPDAVLVLAVQDVRSLTDGERLEGRGVSPTIEVPDALPYAAGRDEIVEAAIEAAIAKANGAN